MKLEFDPAKYEDRIKESARRLEVAKRFQEPDRVPIWELIVNRPVIDALYGEISRTSWSWRIWTGSPWGRTRGRGGWTT